MDSLKEFPASYRDTFAIPLNIFAIIGMDFFDDPNSYVKNRCKFVLFFICFVTFFSSQILFIAMIHKTGGTFLDVANAVPCFFLVCQNVIKLITLTRKKHLLRKIFFDIAELWPSDAQAEDKNTIKNKWLRSLNTFTTIPAKLIVAGTIIYVGIPGLVYFVMSLEDGDAPYMFPFQLYYYFKIDSLWKYAVAYLVQSVVASMIHVCVFHATDLLLYTLTADVCIMIRMLEYDIVNLRVEHEGPEAERCLATLRQIVKTHQKLMRLAEKLNDIFGVIMLGAIGFSSVIFCFFGFLAIVASGKYQIFLNVTNVLHFGFIMLYITLPGQILADTSSEFAYAAYESSWYNGDIRFRRIIVFIIARSQKECKLQCMGYTDMNLRTFCKMCSTAYSYLSLVNQMFQDVELS